ncbi:MAG TPA: amino acid adenylation domain-containing protein [Pseudomonadota bacterium]|nr:amino acid adenylation domain-containing protein [Pseudomonadota bacterium]
MSLVPALLTELRQRGVKLWRDGDRLRFEAPPGAMTPALQERLRLHKPELLALLPARPDQAAAAARAATHEPIQPTPRAGELPLSFAQQRVWLHEKLHGPSATYNLPAAWHLSGPLDRTTLAQSLTEIVRRHESLRTTFTTGADAAQVIQPPQPVAVALRDLRGLAAAEHPAEIQRLLSEESQRPFDLAQGPLLRAQLFQLAPEEHILLMTFHHIAVDGWAIHLFFGELTALYGAYSKGAPSPLSALPIQYGDFSRWQRQQLQGAALAELLNYWRGQLQEAPTLLALPTSRRRPAVQQFAGAAATFELDPGLMGPLKALSRQAGCTLFMTLLAAFNVLLFRYTGQTDLLVGSPIAGRTRQEIEPLIGFFVNTLILRTKLSGEQSFHDILVQVQKTAIAAFAHQELPFEKLLQELRCERSPAHAPLAQVNFALAVGAQPVLKLGGLQIKQLELPVNSTPWDLSLQIQEDPGGLRAYWEYRTDLFDAAQIQRLSVHYQNLLLGMVADPDQSIASLPMLTSAEREQLLVTWNRAQAAPLTPAVVHELIEGQAQSTPDAVAVVWEAQQLTYRELDQQANRLAHYLKSRGVGSPLGPQALVGLCMERSTDMMVGLLGILKAGGAYVPLDPALPQERLAYMIADAQVSLLVTQSALLGRLPSSAQVVCLDTHRAEIARQSRDPVAGAAPPQSLAYVIYTSGSTGRPKGVAVEHRQLFHYVSRISAAIELPARARFAMVSTLAADLGITAIFPTLCTGGTLLILSSAQCTNPERLAADLAHSHDCLKITPSHLEALLSASRPERVLPRQRLVLGGEALSWELIEKIQRLVPRCRIFNEYGPTETTVGVILAGPLEAGDAKLQSEVPPIGRPLADTQVYILDAQRQPVPVGVTGELYLGGAQVARGYLNRPDLTAERFVELRFGDAGLPPQRAYRTGDRARYLADGNIEYLGRLDDQVKLRGFRVELGEVEAVLREHAEVREGVVVLRTDGGAPRLVAYVTPRQTSVDLGGLHSALSQKLPDYMVPAAIVPLAVLPLNANGKLDRQALPAPDYAAATGASAALGNLGNQPSNEFEKILAEIWSDLLKVQQVGIHDNFFKLGGDSILGIQVVARAHRAGLHIPQVFQHPTIARLARAATWRDGAQAEQSPISGPVPLTPIQERFFAGASPAPHHFNMSALHVVRGDLDPELLRAALGQLLLHHDGLRLRFSLTAAGWQQDHAEPAADEAAPLAVVDLSHLSPAEQRAALTTRASELQASLSLSKALLRMVYFTLGSGQPARLLTVVHHLVIDGVSWRILLDDLETAYQQLAQGQRVQLPAKTTSFKAWAQWLKDHGPQVVAADLPYWQKLAQTPATPLPTDYAPEPSAAPATAQLSVALSAEKTDALLHAAPAAYNTQINDLLLTALAKTLSDWTGATHSLIELEGHGREALAETLDPSRTVGWFTSVFPLRLELAGEDAGANLGADLKAIKEQLRQVPSRGISYGILRYLQKDSVLLGMPQAPIGFNYLGQFSPAESTQVQSAAIVQGVATEDIGPQHSAQTAAPYLIHIDGIVLSQRLQLDFIYRADHFERATLQRLADQYLKNLVALIDHCQHCLTAGTGGFTPSDFPDAALSQSELDSLIAELG